MADFDWWISGGKPLLEGRLRDWMRWAWPWPIDWQEAGAGSTPGQPDCWLSLGRGVRVGLELKVGTLALGERLRWELRPAQSRWHHLAKERGTPAGFVVAALCEEEVSVWGLASSACPSLVPQNEAALSRYHLLSGEKGIGLPSFVERIAR